MTMPETTQSDLVERISKRMNDLPLEAEYLLDDCAAEITRLRAHCEALAARIDTFMAGDMDVSGTALIYECLAEMLAETHEVLAAYRKEGGA